MNVVRISAFAFVASLVGIAACSSSDSSGAIPPSGSDAGGGGDSAPLIIGDSGLPPVSATVASACASLADAVCTKIATCTSFGLAVLFGDTETCKARYVAVCTISSTAPGQNSTPDKVNACAASLAGRACGDILALDLGPACTDPGTVKDGDPCGFSAQCESTFCAIAADASCGKCAAPTANEGDACVNGACSAGFICSEVDAKCYRPKAGKVNESCARNSDCDTAHQSGCNPVTKKCIPLTAVEDGTCGADSFFPTKYGVCTRGRICNPAVNGQCTTIAQDNESCSGTGPSCLPLAHCVSGTCRLPSAACR